MRGSSEMRFGRFVISDGTRAAISPAVRWISASSHLSFVLLTASSASEMAFCASATRPHDACAWASHVRLKGTNMSFRVAASADKPEPISLAASSPLSVSSEDPTPQQAQRTSSKMATHIFPTTQTVPRRAASATRNLPHNTSKMPAPNNAYKRVPAWPRSRADFNASSDIPERAFGIAQAVKDV